MASYICCQHLFRCYALTANILHLIDFENVEGSDSKSIKIKSSSLYFDQQSFIPRSFIGAIRSFGNIIEQFNINFNSFISIYSYTTAPSGREYPDGINYINSGIVSTSPYSFFELNIFKGLNSDKLLGVYNGYEQSNSNDRVSNSIWNNVIFKDNVFFGESEFRWHINQRPSVILPPNEANVGHSYDSSFSIKINDRYQEPITRPAPSYL
ncbi:hypothetical protein ACTFIV_000848 [Dictyostelium citrinum]